jgi:hypothetical protein
MKMIDYLKEVSQRAGQELNQTVHNNESLKDHLKRSFNMYRSDFNARNPWPWTEKTTTLQTVTNYDTGTVTVTNGSRTVTGSGTTFTSAMKNRFLKLDKDTEMYEILSFDSTTQLTLKQPYIGDTVSGEGYIIWKRWYDLDPDITYGSQIYLWDWPNKADPIDRMDLDSSFREAHLEGTIYAWAWDGINRDVSTYSTGTVTTTKDSKTLTGSATSFLDNVFAGSKVTIGANDYNVETVDSNTQLTLVQKAISSLSGSAYSAESKERSRIILSACPDPAKNMHITYNKRTYDFLNDNDEVEIWEGYGHLLSNVLYGYLLEKLTSEKAFSWLTVYEAGVNDGWNRLMKAKPVKAPALPRGQRISGYRPTLYT